MFDKTIPYYPSMPLDDIQHYWANGLLTVSVEDEEQLRTRLYAAIRDEQASRQQADHRFDQLERELNQIESEMQHLESTINDQNNRIAEYEEMAATIVPTEINDNKASPVQDSNQTGLGI